MKAIPEVKQPHCSHAQSVKEEAVVCDDANANCKKEDVQCYKTEKHVVLDYPGIRASDSYSKTIKNLGEFKLVH